MGEGCGGGEGDPDWTAVDTSSKSVDSVRENKIVYSENARSEVHIYQAM